jgi:hypothetical protein
MDTNNIGHGNLLAFLLAYGWGILLFLALLGSLGVGIYWIATAVANKISKDQGRERIKTIGWTVGIVGAILVTSFGLFIQLGAK